MSGDFANVPARVVTAGIGPDGRSTVISDRETPARVVTPAFAIMDILRINALPVRLDDEHSVDATAQHLPQPGSLIYRIATFPPDTEWNFSGDYHASLEAAGGGDTFVEADIPGLHQTDTVDVITVISGELYAVLEDGETLLRPGDSFIQTGTKHSWSNRSSEPAVIVTILASAVRLQTPDIHTTR